jgi:hypothetical protein
VAWILARQIRGGPDQAAAAVARPADPGYPGIRALPASTGHVPADPGLLAVSAALPARLGIWRGQTIMVWRDADGAW